MGRKIGLGRIWSFVLGFRSLVARLVPFEREGTKPEGEKNFGNHECELIANFSATMVTSPWRERREVWREKRKAEFLARESASSSPIVRIFGKGKCKFIANFSATMVTSLPSLSLCLYLSLSLSLSHRKYLMHNIGSASALPIINFPPQSRLKQTCKCHKFCFSPLFSPEEAKLAKCQEKKKLPL